MTMTAPVPAQASQQILPVSPPASASSEDILYPYACRVCVQRKVKCDKRKPCSSCVKSRLQCAYATTPPQPRRKRKLEHASANVNRGLPLPHAFDPRIEEGPPRFEPYERPFEHLGLAPSARTYDHVNLLPSDHSHTPGGRRHHGHVESIQSGLQTPVPNSPPGILIAEDGGRRYYGNGLMGGISQEYRQDPPGIPNHLDRSEDAHHTPDRTRQGASDFLAASILHTSGLPTLRAEAAAAYQSLPDLAPTKLWSIFMRNVHPLTMIVHAPTVHARLFESAVVASSNSNDALKLSIYACAISSLADKECREIFGESQVSLRQAFQAATRSALLESSYLQIPDIDLLRANVLLLTSMLDMADASSLWILMGSTVRMAQSQGLHRDGVALGLPPFDIEMRRRLWWYIVALDGRLAELTGSSSSLPKSMDTLLPTNADDKDLDPEMTSLPEARVGTTEMTFCLLKYEIGRFIQEHDHPSHKTTRKDGKRSLSDLENILEEKFLRFCDPVIPVQFMTTLVARSAVCKLRQMVQHMRSRPNPDEPRTASPDQARAQLAIAKRNVEYHNLIHASKSLGGFLWLANFHFPWGAAISILRYLASCSVWDDDMEAAWAQIQEVYNNHPEYLETDKVMYSTLRSLTLKAWTGLEAILEARGLGTLPPVVVELQKRQAVLSSRHNNSKVEILGTGNEGYGGADLASFNEGNHFAELYGFDTITFDNYDYLHPTLGGMDWSEIAGQQVFPYSVST